MDWEEAAKLWNHILCTWGSFLAWVWLWVRSGPAPLAEPCFLPALPPSPRGSEHGQGRFACLAQQASQWEDVLQGF